MISCQTQGVSPKDTLRTLRQCVRAIEIDGGVVRQAREALSHVWASTMGETGEDCVAWKQIITQGDFLSCVPDFDQFDVIVGNFPYVRYDAIRELPWVTDPKEWRNRFDSFRGRADYSVAFFQRSLELLSEDGQAAVISSNRFTRAEYGTELRKQIANFGFELHEVDLSDISAFEESVTAYSSLFLLVHGTPRYSRYIHLKSTKREGISRLADLGARRVRSSRWYTSYTRERLPIDGTPWAPLPAKVVSALRRLVRIFPSMREIGVDIRKGPATGADRVFIGRFEDFPFERSSKTAFLLPLFRSGSCKLPPTEIPDRYLLSVYEHGTKRLLSLGELPLDVQEYLLSHRSKLEERHIVKEQGKEWWRTIDSFDPALVYSDKVLIPDLQRGAAVRVDQGKLMPAHTVLYAAAEPKSLSNLARLFKSPVTDLFRFWNAPSMRNGTPRASSRVLSRLPCPDLVELDGIGREPDDFTDVHRAYGLRPAEVRAIENALLQAFGSLNLDGGS